MSDATLPILLRLLDAVLCEGAPSDRTLRTLLRAVPTLTARERALIARRGLGTIVLRNKLDHLTRRADNRHRLAAYLVIEEGVGRDQAEAFLELAPEALAALDTPPVWPSDPILRLAAYRSLPPWLARLWYDEWGAAADPLAAAANTPGPTVLRANRLQNDRETLAAILDREGIATRPTPYAPEGLQVIGRANLFGSTAWREGRFEVQDEGSQLVIERAAARPGMSVLDLCAGAGGKTLGLAASMRNLGRLFACDIDPLRLTNLRARARRAGVTVATVLSLPTSSSPLPDTISEVDLALVDAPCSSLGTLRRSPNARWRLSETDLAGYPPLQLELLERAAARVRAGGRLVYATCTLRRAENEAVIQEFLRRSGSYTLIDAVTLTPHDHGTDGFFIATLASSLH